MGKFNRVILLRSKYKTNPLSFTFCHFQSFKFDFYYFSLLSYNYAKFIPSFTIC